MAVDCATVHPVDGRVLAGAAGARLVEGQNMAIEYRGREGKQRTTAELRRVGSPAGRRHRHIGHAASSRRQGSEQRRSPDDLRGGRGPARRRPRSQAWRALAATSLGCSLAIADLAGKRLELIIARSRHFARAEPGSGGNGLPSAVRRGSGNECGASGSPNARPRNCTFEIRRTEDFAAAF